MSLSRDALGSSVVQSIQVSPKSVILLDQKGFSKFFWLRCDPYNSIRAHTTDFPPILCITSQRGITLRSHFFALYIPRRSPYLFILISFWNNQFVIYLAPAHLTPTNTWNSIFGSWPIWALIHVFVGVRTKKLAILACIVVTKNGLNGPKLREMSLWHG